MAIEPRFVRNFLLWSLQPGDSLRDALAHGKGEDYPVCLGRRAAFFPYFVHTCCWVVQASHWKYRFGVVKYRRLYILEIVTIHAGSPYLYLPTSTLGCDRGIFNGSSRYGSNTFLPNVSYVVLHFWAMHIIIFYCRYLFPAQYLGGMFPSGKKQNDFLICVSFAGIESSNQVGCQCMLYWSLWALVRRGNFLFELWASCVVIFSLSGFTLIRFGKYPTNIWMNLSRKCHIYMYMYTHTHIYIYVHTYIYIYTSIYIYICVCEWLFICFR